MRNGEVLISDGPFAETKELMVGYDMLDCADLDEAIEVASKHPLAKPRRDGTPAVRRGLTYGRGQLGRFGLCDNGPDSPRER